MPPPVTSKLPLTEQIILDKHTPAETSEETVE
jgi:hypothetical protein